MQTSNQERIEDASLTYEPDTSDSRILLSKSDLVYTGATRDLESRQKSKAEYSRSSGKHRVRSRPEDVFDCYVVTESRLIPAKLTGFKGFVVDVKNGCV